MSNGSTGSKAARRAIVLVIDGCGIGASPDAASFGDSAICNTLANTARHVGGLHLPNLERLGLGKVSPIDGIASNKSSNGLYGKLRERSNGKDTQTGHWEMMGVVSTKAFPTYPDGFPPEVISEFIEKTGCKNILCNKPASGTTILEELGEEHARTGYPIVYTSGDSVFQIATNVEVTPLDTLYKWCEIAREMLQGPHRVGRVIARPFKGAKGAYKRLSGERRDYAVPPPEPTLLDRVKDSQRGVLGIGKIEDIFVGNGLTHAKHTGSNLEGLELTLQSIQNKLELEKLLVHGATPKANDDVQLIFTNLVDTDSLYGHRRDVSGYGTALLEIDEWVGRILENMQDEDLLLISSDHGNDPTAPGTDHTREFVPLLGYSPVLAKKSSQEGNIGERDGFVDIAASLADWLGVSWSGAGKSIVTPSLLSV
jgi:phosphopentomutase